MSILFDAGALIAAGRGSRRLLSLVRDERSFGRRVATHGGVIGQVWRSGSRQALLAAAMLGMDVVALDRTLGKRAGELLAKSGTRDVVDAALVALARDGDVILTSDVKDLVLLAEAAAVDVDLVRV